MKKLDLPQKYVLSVLLSACFNANFKMAEANLSNEYENIPGGKPGTYKPKKEEDKTDLVSCYYDFILDISLDTK